MLHSMTLKRGLAGVLAAAGLAAGVAACGDDEQGGGKPVVTATAPQVEVLTRALAGDGVEVPEVVPATADVHELELRPSQVRALRDADVILRPGRENDAWASEAIDGSSAEQVDVAAGIPGDDRHWWMDPTAAITAATSIAAELDKVDAAGKDERASALAELTTRLERVDAATKKCLAAVPAASRRIVTDHDAIGAYASRYGLDVVGTIAPGSEPEASPSAKRLVELERTMRERGVTAVFPIAPHGSKLVEQVAERGEARVGDALWADALPGATHDHAHEDEAAHAEEAHADEGEPAATTDEHLDGSHDLLTEAALLNGHAIAEALRAPDSACGDL